jgi:hypothetical protein
MRFTFMIKLLSNSILYCQKPLYNCTGFLIVIKKFAETAVNVTSLQNYWTAL